MPFGQVVIGPPGSGKTTYCNGSSQFLKALERKVVLVNLDPANDLIPYKADIDINDLITLKDTMEELGLGPNGGMIYCLEYLAKNIKWLDDLIENFKDGYFIFDLPGQIELYTHNQSVRTIINHLTKKDFRLCSVHLVDSHYCTDPSKYISALLVSLNTMLMLELPHVNVLSKLDLIESYGKLAFDLEYYTEVMDLSYLLQPDPDSTDKYQKLTESLAEVVEEFGLVHFHPLMVEDKKSMTSLTKAIDKATGYVFGGLDKDNSEKLTTSAIQADDPTDLLDHLKDLYLIHDD